MQTLKLTKKYDKYPEYKDSGVEWLGDIPKGWKLDNIHHLFTKVKRMGFENEQLLSVYRDLGVIVKSSRDDNHNKASDDLSTYQLVEIGDLAINKMKAWQGSLAVSEYRGIVSPAYFICKPLSNNNSRFLHYLLRSDIYIKQYERNSGGVRNDQWDLNYDRFRKIEIGIPNITEQTKIANYLDKKISYIDQIIEKKQVQIAFLVEKRITVINRAVSKGLDAKAEFIESGVEWIGKIPKGWKMRKIFHLFKIIGSGTTPDEKYLTDSELGIPWVNTGDLTDSYIELPSKKVRPEALIECSALKLFSKNAVVIAMYGATIGKLGIPQFDFCTNQACCVLEGPDKSISEKFVYYWLLGNKKYIVEMGVGGGQPNINKDIVKSLKLSLPSQSTQEEIIAYLDKKVVGYDKAIKCVEQSIEKLKEFKSSLISNVVTGKVKV